MSRYFVLPEEGVGEGGDITFRRHPAEKNWYRVFVGDSELGFISWSTPFKTWNAWSFNFDNKTMNNQVDGFKIRLHAAFFIIKHWGYWNADRLSQRGIQINGRGKILTR